MRGAGKSKTQGVRRQARLPVWVFTVVIALWVVWPGVHASAAMQGWHPRLWGIGWLAGVHFAPAVARGGTRFP